MSIRFLLYAIFCTVIAILLAVSVYLYQDGTSPLPLVTDRYTIEPGQTLTEIAADMEKRGIISDRYVLIGWAKFKNVARQVQAGEYRFEPGSNTVELLNKIVAGKVIKYSITFIEGWNFRQLLASLQKENRLTHVLEGLTPERIMQRLGFPGKHPEGLFYPDTYQFSKGESDINILRQAYERMQFVLNKNLQDRRSESNFSSDYEVLILASIVEKETGKTDERGTIAGVFLNRLKIGMRLQSDPTVIYGLGVAYDGDITRKHLTTDTPYNTYTRYGLPPTPIAMPGEASIRAVLHPTNTNAKFFVAKGDGSHEFSETLEQHNRAVTEFQINRNRQAYRSSPLPTLKTESANGPGAR